jgi:L-lactate dehydrogenase (cytochrome)
MVGTMLRTLINHGMPHFENSFATRGAPLLSGTAIRDTSGRDHLNWKNIERIRQRWKGNLIIKGILNEDDAVMATDIGAQGIVVSNHGGRQLDGVVAPLQMLPYVVDRVGHRTAVMMDSGIRRGSDVLKAVALGARMVFLGRPFMYAAAVHRAFITPSPCCVTRWTAIWPCWARHPWPRSPKLPARDAGLKPLSL